MAAPLRLALVGAGRRARAHQAALQALPEAYAVVAVCDPDPAAREAMSAALGCPGYSDAREALSQRPDVVDLVTPAETHHALAVWFAGHGVHVVVETPAAPTVPLTRAMAAAAEQGGVLLAVAENAFRDPRARIWSGVVRSGLLGEVLRVHNLGMQSAYHGTNLVSALLGAEPTRVRAVKQSSPIAALVDDKGAEHWAERWIVAIVEYDGAVGLFEDSNLIRGDLLGRRQAPRLQIDGTRGTLTNDTLQLQGAAHFIQATTADGTLQRLELTPDGGPPLRWDNPHAALGPVEPGLVELLLELAAAINGEGALAYAPQDAALDLAAALAMEESAARGGMPLSLPLSHPTAHEREIHEALRGRLGADPFDAEAVLEALARG